MPQNIEIKLYKVFKSFILSAINNFKTWDKEVSDKLYDAYCTLVYKGKEVNWPFIHVCMYIWCMLAVYESHWLHIHCFFLKPGMVISNDIY